MHFYILTSTEMFNCLPHIETLNLLVFLPSQLVKNNIKIKHVATVIFHFFNILENT